MRKPASRDNPAARELKITRVRNIDRVKAMREYSRSGLLILERILIFDEEGVKVKQSLIIRLALGLKS